MCTWDLALSSDTGTTDRNYPQLLGRPGRAEDSHHNELLLALQVPRVMLSIIKQHQGDRAGVLRLRGFWEAYRALSSLRTT
jgi:hypothetical protein